MDDLCPKCGVSKSGGEACPRCGLVFARFDEAALAVDVPPGIEALFAHAEADWGDRARHALFVEKALAAGAAGYAASRYRRRGPDEIAREQLAHRPSVPYLLLLILFLGAGALGLALLWR